VDELLLRFQVAVLRPELLFLLSHDLLGRRLAWRRGGRGRVRLSVTRDPRAGGEKRASTEPETGIERAHLRLHGVRCVTREKLRESKLCKERVWYTRSVGRRAQGTARPGVEERGFYKQG
jgi:hypothetical protein